ncbi:protein mono-ADP-ribosyltransferase PARP9-like [Salvelinus alpinus]|uniref:protein mono-ADP-ribosyltransferase PARP9-like n=1 Tax=Salvelinus alpinus TaxID=8036 RepID=UPI0039FC0366
MDKVIGTYSCRWMTARWPLVIFHNIIDVSSYNSFVIWNKINPTWMPDKRIKRWVFLEQLGKALVIEEESASASQQPLQRHLATNERRYPRGGASPYIELSSAHNDILREAKCWLTYAFMMPSENFTILNGFIQHFGQREFDKLSLQTKWNVSIEEFFKDGCPGVIIQGSSRGVRASVLELEAIFCKLQEDFAKKEESDMGLKSSNNFSRKPVENNSSDDFSGLEIVRVEKVENSTLKHLFELKKRPLQSASSQRMYQRLPAQYCDLVSRVGFKREFAPPDEQNHGEGIYFSSSVHGTEKLWMGLADEYLYFVAAQVLTGKSTIGTPGLIVPPETPGGDPLTLYDSVEGGVDTCVIFNGHQALPEYLIICTNKNFNP